MISESFTPVLSTVSLRAIGGLEDHIEWIEAHSRSPCSKPMKLFKRRSKLASEKLRNHNYGVKTFYFSYDPSNRTSSDIVQG